MKNLKALNLAYAPVSETWTPLLQFSNLEKLTLHEAQNFHAIGIEKIKQLESLRELVVIYNYNPKQQPGIIHKSVEESRHFIYPFLSIPQITKFEFHDPSLLIRHTIGRKPLVKLMKAIEKENPDREITWDLSVR